LRPPGDIGYSLKTPYRDGATHVISEPLDFIARPAALVPPPRLNVTRFHAGFGPNNPHRAGAQRSRRQREQSGTARRSHAGRATSRDVLGATPWTRLMPHPLCCDEPGRKQAG